MRMCTRWRTHTLGGLSVSVLLRLNGILFFFLYDTHVRLLQAFMWNANIRERTPGLYCESLSYKIFPKANYYKKAGKKYPELSKRNFLNIEILFAFSHNLKTFFWIILFKVNKNGILDFVFLICYLLKYSVSYQWFSEFFEVLSLWNRTWVIYFYGSDLAGHFSACTSYVFLFLLKKNVWRSAANI